MSVCLVLCCQAVISFSVPAAELQCNQGSMRWRYLQLSERPEAIGQVGVRDKGTKVSDLYTSVYDGITAPSQVRV